MVLSGLTIVRARASMWNHYWSATTALHLGAGHLMCINVAALHFGAGHWMCTKRGCPASWSRALGVRMGFIAKSRAAALKLHQPSTRPAGRIDNQWSNWQPGENGNCKFADVSGDERRPLELLRRLQVDDPAVRRTLPCIESRDGEARGQRPRLQISGK